MFLDKSIERINEIGWDVIGTKESEEQAHLGYEFFRRLANFFKNESIQPRRPLYSNIAQLLGDTEEEIDISSYCNSEVVKFLGDDISINNIIKYYIQLAKYADENQDAIKYLSVYEPLIRVFEEGGMFVLRTHTLEIKKVGDIPLDGWYERFVTAKSMDIDKLG